MKKRRATAQRARSVWSAIGVGLWVIAPLVVATFAVASVSRVEIAPPADVWIHAEAGAAEIDRPVGVQLHWSGASELHAPAWQGVVQRVYVREGKTLTSGGRVAKIDGVDRVAYSSSTPFYRTLRAGDSGPDVTALNHLLRSRGLKYADSDRFTWDTSLGVRAFREELGVRTTAPAQFDPGWLVYLPVPKLTVDAVMLSVGALAPAAGEIVVTSARSLRAASLIDVSNIPSLAEESERQDFEAFATISATVDEKLIVGTTELVVSEDLDAVGGESLTALTGIVEYLAPFTRGNLVQALPRDHVRLPASAVITDRTGTFCVLKAVNRSREGEVLAHVPVIITIASAGDGVVWASGALTIDDLVNSSPPSSERSCTKPASTT